MLMMLLILLDYLGGPHIGEHLAIRCTRLSETKKKRLIWGRFKSQSQKCVNNIFLVPLVDNNLHRNYYKLFMKKCYSFISVERVLIILCKKRS